MEKGCTERVNRSTTCKAVCFLQLLRKSPWCLACAGRWPAPFQACIETGTATRGAGHVNMCLQLQTHLGCGYKHGLAGGRPCSRRAWRPAAQRGVRGGRSMSGCAVQRSGGCTPTRRCALPPCWLAARLRAEHLLSSGMVDPASWSQASQGV